MQMKKNKLYLFIFWILRVQNFIYRAIRVMLSLLCTTAAFFALFTSMESLPSKAGLYFFKKITDETSVRWLIPILGCLIAPHRSLLFPGRNPSLCGSTLLWCPWIQKHDFFSPVLPRKNTGSLPRPLSIVTSQAYSSLIALDGDAEELIDS